MESYCKFNGIGVRRIRMSPFSSDSAYDFVAFDPVNTRLLGSEAEAEKSTNHDAWTESRRSYFRRTVKERLIVSLELF